MTINPKDQSIPVSGADLPENSSAGNGTNAGDGLTRRGFLGTVGAGSAIVAATTSLGGCSGGDGQALAAGAVGPESAFQRRLSARDVRINTAQEGFLAGTPAQSNNGDEDRYPTRYGSFSKTLPHNSLGEPDAAAYAVYLSALSSGNVADFNAIPAGPAKLHSPQAGICFEMAGIDHQAVAMPHAPTFRSAEQASEMVENYWMSMLRDVWYENYGSDMLVGSAIADLNAMSDFRAPKVAGAVTPGTVFRGPTAGDLAGPYISQFLLSPFNYGSIRVEQKHRTGVAGVDYMTQVGDGTTDFQWLHLQNGGNPAGSAFQQVSFANSVYIRDFRSLARSVRDDPLYQFYYNAALMCLQSGVPLQSGNYYKTSTNQLAFATLGPPHIFDLVAKACGQALRNIWYHKWNVHRRIRPEEYAGRVHFHQANQATYELHSDVLNSAAVSRLLMLNGTALCPQAYPEGCPPHPSYGAGHNVVAAAGVTILKAFFDGSTLLANLPATAATTLKTPKVSAADGLSLVNYMGSDAGQLTVGGELDKMASNVAMGRNCASVHWRTEALESFKIGEAVAVSILREMKATVNEPFSSTFIGFDGSTVVI